jgi:hypothetical protein
MPLVNKNIAFVPLPAKRRRQIQGQWRGTTRQSAGPDGTPIEVDLVTEITVSWRTVRTKTRMKGGGVELMSESKGGFVTDEYLKVDYKSIDSAKLNFGTTLLRLSADGARLTGQTLGYGFKSERIVHGEVELVKIA